jgi:hypothetical protein
MLVANASGTKQVGFFEANGFESRALRIRTISLRVCFSAWGVCDVSVLENVG